MTDTPRSNAISPVVTMGSGGPDLTAPEQVDKSVGMAMQHGLHNTAATLRALEAERDAALDALEPFNLMAGVLFAMNYELSDEVFSIKSAHGEVAMTFEAFLNAHAAARQKGGEG